ncbi:MAG: hypothetical protein IJ929_08260 [Prevotella sp.]|nr:hypothetical protein [Prevotella sp.]
MKKMILFLAIALSCSMGTFAQSSLVATLQHGSNIQAFYGIDALSSAHTAAVDGDIITLSTGEFNSCDITKVISLRGEGIGKTILNSYITFTIPHGSAYTLNLEGLQFGNSSRSIGVSITGTDGTERVVISKCLFHLWQRSISITNCNATIVQCRTNYGQVEARGNSNITCQNSKLGVSRNENSHFDIQNCVLVGGYDMKYSSIKNSIIDWASSSWSLDASSTSTHCLVINDASGFANSWYVDSWENIIVGNPRDMNEQAYSPYQLTESAASTYLGTDGTQVGIYGGMYPYDETPSYPLVKTLDVIGTHSNGKLNVKINVE